MLLEMVLVVVVSCRFRWNKLNLLNTFRYHRNLLQPLITIGDQPEVPLRNHNASGLSINYEFSIVIRIICYL